MVTARDTFGSQISGNTTMRRDDSPMTIRKGNNSKNVSPSRVSRNVYRQLEYEEVAPGHTNSSNRKSKDVNDVHDFKNHTFQNFRKNNEYETIQK